MSDNIDISMNADGDDGVNRLTSSIDRLIASMERLGENSASSRLQEQMQQMQSATSTALGALTSQMQEMKQVLATGFADISATNQKLIESMGARQVRAIEESGTAAATAMTEAGNKIKAADARTWEQIQRGSASNVTAAFNQLAQGIPVEAVTERYGRMAAAAAQSLDGQLASLKQFQANAKSMYLTDYKPLAGASAVEIDQAHAMNAARDNASAEAQAARQMKIDEQSLASKWRNMLDLDAKEDSAKEAQAARWRSIDEASEASKWRNFLDITAKQDAEKLSQAARWAQMDEMSQASSWTNFLQIERQKEAEEAARAARWLRLDETAQASSWTNFLDIEAKKEAAEASRIARARALQEQSDASAWRNFLDLEAKKVAAAESNALKNASYATASPVSQLQTQLRAVGMRGEELDPTQFVGSKAAADAAGKSVASLRAEMEALKATSAGAAAAQFELGGALNQVEGAFRGAAHEAGIYGMHHGQLIGLLAGGAVAAGLHHIAETGAEVEFQLSSLSALSGNMQPIDVDKFIGITSGTMTGLKDAAEGVHALAQAGQSQQAAFAALGDVMRLAQLGEMSVAQAAEMAVESMHAFGKSIADLGQIGDILVAVGSQSNVSVHKLAEDMKSAATTGAMFNLNMQEITATVGALAERGLTIQPLSSALMKLYEPSQKTAKAMQELGLSTKDGEGNLKNYTQFMGELAEKVNQFKVPADIYKNLGMSSRDAKAIEVMTQDLEGYHHLLDVANESQGKMFEATMVKANTAKGAYEMLGSTVDGSLYRAFEAAEPLIRAVETDLIAIASSQATIDFLSGLATGFARLTQDIIENRDLIMLAVGAYATFRVTASALDLVAAASKAWTEATVVSTAAVATQGAVTTATGAQLDLFAVEEGVAAAGAVELGAGAGVAAVGIEGVALAARSTLAIFGPLGLALAGITVAMDLFAGSQTKAEEETQKALNSGASSITMYETEIARLRALEEQLLKTGKAGADAANEVAIANLEMEKTAVQGQVDKARREAGPDLTGPSGVDAPLIAPVSDLDNALDRLKAINKELEKRNNLQITTDALRDRTSDESKVNELRGKIDELPAHIEAPTGATKAMRDAAEAAESLHQHLIGTIITSTNLVEVTKEQKDLEELIAASKKDAPVKAAASTEKDTARQRIESIQEELRLAQEAYKVRIATLQSENKRGELGDLQLINAELREKLTLDQKALTVAEREMAAAGPLKPSQRQKYQSKIDTAQARLGEDGLDAQEAQRKRLDLLDKMDGQELTARAKAMESRGQLEDAYNLTYQAKNANLLANLARDIEDADNGQYRDRLVRYQQFLDEQRRLGANDARFKEGEREFGNAQSALGLNLNNLKLQSGPGTGAGSSITNQLAQRDAIGASLPDMQAAYTKTAASSSIMFGADPAKLKAAQNQLKEIQDQLAAMRNIGVTLGDTIAKALTDAFGKGGAAAGGMLSSVVAYQTKLAEIQDTLKNSDGGDDAKKKAADDTASAQVKSYSDMTTAAKGFFDTNSNGYKILGAAEHAFRVIQLVEEGAALAKKLGFKAAEVTANVAGDAAKVGSGTAATAVDVANAGTSASAWGITAVAKALASLPPPLNFVAGAAVLAALVGVGVKIAGSFGGGSTTTADRQAANGTGTIAGDGSAKSDSIAKSLSAIDSNTYNGLAVSQGMLSSLQAIENSMSSFAGLLVRGQNFTNPDVNLGNNGTHVGTLGLGLLGNAITAVVSKIPLIGGLLGKLSTTLFGGKQTLDDTGFTVAKESAGDIAKYGAASYTYADVTTSGGLFSGDSHSSQYSKLATDANDQVTKVIVGIGDTIKLAASILGVSGSAFDAKLNSFVVDLGNISLKGLSSADQQTAIQNAFSKLGDQMASFALSTITQFAKNGEGALETLTRVASDYQTVDAVFSSFGLAFSQVGEGSIAAREDLVNLAGGLDKFVSQADYFLKNILPAGQQVAAARAQIAPTLQKYGLSADGAGALAAYANVTIAFGAMGAAGAQAYTELMNIAPAMKQITDAAKSLQDQIDDLTQTQAQKDAATRASLDPANQALFDQVQKAKAVSQAKSDLASAYQTESSAMQSAIDKLKSFSTALHSFVTNLTMGNLSPLNPTDKYAAALAQFNTTLQKAQAGDTQAQSDFQSVAQNFLQASQAANASNGTYQSDYQRVLAVSDQLATWADSQVNSGQASLNALYQQVSLLTTLNTSTLSVREAVANLNTTQYNGGTLNNAAVVSSVFQEMLGHLPDMNTLSQWTSAMAAGTSLATLIEGMKHTQEYVDYTTAHPATATSNLGMPSLTSGSPYQAPPDPGAYFYMTHPDPAPAPATSNPSTSTSSGASYYTPPDAGAYFYMSSMDTQPTQSLPDPYMAMYNQNNQIISHLATMNTQIAGLRQDAGEQADNQVDATMRSSANTADQVVEAVTTSAADAAWNAKNTATTR